MIDVGKDLPKKLDDVPGWLSYGDQLVFQWLLEWQSRTQEPSDLVEVGVYKGKSAIHLGRFLRDGERLTVCDLFDVAGSEETIRDDVRRAYASLSQDEFESNYLAFHDELPEIIRGPVSYTHLRAHETVLELVCRLLLEKKNIKNK